MARLEINKKTAFAKKPYTVACALALALNAFGTTIKPETSKIAKIFVFAFDAPKMFSFPYKHIDLSQICNR